jgi:hypothetical protein
MLHVLRLHATGNWLVALSVGLFATIGVTYAGTPSTAGSQPIDPSAFTTCAQLPPHVDLKSLTDT